MLSNNADQSLADAHISSLGYLWLNCANTGAAIFPYNNNIRVVSILTPVIFPKPWGRV